MTTNTMERMENTAPKVMVAGFAVLAALAWVGIQLFVYKAVDPVAVVIGMVAIACAALVASGKRWGLMTAVVVAAAMALFDLPVFVQRLGNPGATSMFVVSLIGLVTYVAILGAGVIGLQSHRGSRS